jgi:hypothetical protein
MEKPSADRVSRSKSMKLPTNNLRIGGEQCQVQSGRSGFTRNPAQAHLQHCASLQQQAAAIQGQMANTHHRSGERCRANLGKFDTG